MPLIKTGRVDLWITDHRRHKDAIPTILIHGAGGSHLSFPAESRRQGPLETVLVDLSGHGKSGGAGRNSIEEYALDIVALLDALEIDRTIVLGHSMGGAIAQQLALVHAERVEAIVLLGTGARLPVNPALITGMENDPMSTIDKLVRWMWSNDAAAELRQQSEETMRATAARVLRDDFIACDKFDLARRLAEITVPTLIIAGELDRMTPLALSQELANGITDSRLVVIPAAGHMMLLEHPAQTWMAIVDWQGQLD